MSQPASLKRNIINLFISQGASFIIPLLQFPYLTRILGVKEFGLFVFSYSVILFSMIITNYGFELYLPNEMARKREQKHTNEYFTHSLIIRMGLFLTALIGLVGVYFATSYYHGREELLALIACAVFFNSFTFLWLFQGKEVIYLYSRITVTLRLVSVGLVFWLVKGQDDLSIVLGLLAATNAVVLLTSYFIAKNKFSIKLVRIKLSDTWHLVKGSFEYFISRLGVSLYATLGGFMIGALSGSLTQVAYYGAAHQLYTAGLQAISAISTPLLPYMARTKNFNVLFKITVFSLFLTLIGSVLGIALGEYILIFVYGVDLAAAKPVLNIFMIIIFLSVLGQHLGYPALLPLGKGRQANLSVMYAGLTQVIMIIGLFLFDVSVTAVAMAITYFFCDLVMCSYRGIVFAKEYKRVKKC